MPCRCRYRHRIELQRVARAHTAAGYVETWPTYARIKASVDPATPTSLGGVVAATVTTPITHLVTVRYRAGVLARDRVWFRGRALHIGAIQNPDEANRTLVLACEERQP